MRRKLKFSEWLIVPFLFAAFILLVMIVVAGLFVLVRGTWLDGNAFALPALIIGFAVAFFTSCGIAAICKGFLRGKPPARWDGDGDTR